MAYLVAAAIEYGMTMLSMSYEGAWLGSRFLRGSEGVSDECREEVVEGVPVVNVGRGVGVEERETLGERGQRSCRSLL